MQWFDRGLGIKLGIAMIIISFILITQLHLKHLFGIPVILEDYFRITVPVQWGPINIIPFLWIALALGVLFLVTAIKGVPPFNF